jgi:hypothetical protein
MDVPPESTGLPMRIFPKNKWRLVLSVGVPVLLSLLVFPPWWWLAQIRMQGAFLFHSRVTDRVNALTFKEEWRFEQLLQQVDDESGVDVRFLLVPHLEGQTLEDYSVQQARALGVGRDADRRGLLIVYDTTAKRLRLEVGTRLEGVITDAFAGYLMREHVRSFFGAGNIQLGLLTTIMIVQHRLREGVLGEEFDPRFTEMIRDVRRLAVGGGASAEIQRSNKRSEFLNRIQPSNAATRRHFAPQPTPEAAHQRYLEWLAAGGYATDVPLFTSLSQGYLGSLPMTRGFNDFLLAYEYNEPYRIDVRDSLALLYFTGNPLVGPHFLRRTPRGWVLDIFAEILNTRNYAGGPYSWGMADSGDDFNTTFGDRIIEVGPILRLAGGDNRPLPVRAHLGRDVLAGESATVPVERLTVVELGRRVSSQPDSRPAMVILYYSRGRNSRAGFPRLVEIANGCKQAGGDVLALSIDDDAHSVRKLANFVEKHRATFAPMHLQRWPSGQLAGTLDPLGFDIGDAFGVPMVGVRQNHRVLIQAEGHSQVASVARELIQACHPSPYSVR